MYWPSCYASNPPHAQNIYNIYINTFFSGGIEELVP